MGLSMTHQVYFNKNGRPEKVLVSGSFLDIHSSLFHKQITHKNSVICLPQELDDVSVYTILDYLHGFQLQIPPDDAIDDLYAVATYFKLIELKKKIVQRFCRKISRSQFNAIDDFVSKLPVPKFCPEGTLIGSI